MVVQPVSRLTTSATDATISVAPIMIVAVMLSSSRIHPRKIATTGFTYAYVETFEIGAFLSSHVYALYATSEPAVTSHTKPAIDASEKLPTSTLPNSPAKAPTTIISAPEVSICNDVDSIVSPGSDQ